MGCELWGLEYFSPGRHSTVRLYIDGPNGVTLEDCERVSRQVSSVMDVEICGGIQPRSVFARDGSPFMGHFARAKASRLVVCVPLRDAASLMALNGVEDDDILLVVDGNEYLLPIDLIEKANIVPRFKGLTR